MAGPLQLQPPTKVLAKHSPKFGLLPPTNVAAMGCPRVVADPKPVLVHYLEPARVCGVGTGAPTLSTGEVTEKTRLLSNTFWSKKGLTKATSGSKQQDGVCENRWQSWWALGQIASIGARIERNRQQG